jgi:hypothetical protein
MSATSYRKPSTAPSDEFRGTESLDSLLQWLGVCPRASHGIHGSPQATRLQPDQDHDPPRPYTHAPDLIDAKAALGQLRLSLGGVLYVDGGWAKLAAGLAASASAAGAVIRAQSRYDFPLNFFVRQIQCVCVLARADSIYWVAITVNEVSDSTVKILPCVIPVSISSCPALQSVPAAFHTAVPPGLYPLVETSIVVCT